MKKTNLKIFGLFVVLGLFLLSYFSDAFAKNLLQISVVYPQKSNFPKREVKKTEKPMVLQGEIAINAVGIKPEQIKHTDVYVEYFLDGQLLYSSENKEADKTTKAPAEFILDTTAYPDGEHTLVVNFWDKDGPSAIGIRKIIIQNVKKDEN